ncbi:MAG: imidazole glycerol phosphate synthase subunit HisH [Anaerolineae bacterium]
MLAVVDYGAGNLRSVLHALNYLGVKDVRVAKNPHELHGAERIILPGVGAFGAGMQQLEKQGLVRPLIDAAHSGIPWLGVCVGMQFLFERSDEMGEHRGLGIIPGYVTRFPQMGDLKIPHMGWNEVRLHRQSQLTNGIEDGSYGYFVHSYHCVPSDPLAIVAIADYGISVTAIVQHKNIYGVQFHPEKSQTMGLRIYANFLETDA